MHRGIVTPITEHGYRAYIAQDCEGRHWQFAQGSLILDANGVTFTPSSYRRRQGVPTLEVAMDDIARVTTISPLSMAPATLLLVHLNDGTVWILKARAADEAAAHIQSLGCPVN